jgi:hypothetical protein
MAQQITDLMPFWKDLSYAEKYDIVKEIRLDKYDRKPIINKTKKKAAKKAKKSASKKAAPKKKKASKKEILKQLNSLTPDQLAKIKAQLGG